MPTARLATIASAGVRRLITLSGTTGWAARASTRVAITRMATPPPAMAAVCQESQSKELPTKVTQMSSTLTPAAIRVAPR
jgi:hypothetical protein